MWTVDSGRRGGMKERSNRLFKTRTQHRTVGNSVWRRTHPYAVVSTAMVSISFSGAPYRATKRCTGWVKRREQGLCWVLTDACERCHWDLR
eukprot:1430539-Pyramimonas_sp.AAC.1